MTHAPTYTRYAVDRIKHLLAITNNPFNFYDSVMYDIETLKK